MPARELAASCRELVVDYRTASAGSVRALDEVDVAVERARMTVVAGPSGSGKSSLLRVLAGLHECASGSVTVDGIEISRLRAGARRRLRRRQMGFVLQDPADNLLEYLTAIEQVQLAARLRGSAHQDPRPLLDAVGLSDRLDCRPGTLSGGEQQRVAFAAAAVGQPALLLADEPTAELDATAGADLVIAMRGLVDRGATLVVASHDAAVIEAADEVVWLRSGRVVPE